MIKLLHLVQFIIIVINVLNAKMSLKKALQNELLKQENVICENFIHR